jgi:D-alanyl-D-alanine carboxypeptidase
VARYVPDFPHGDGLAIRQLLQHTSGLPDFGRAKDLNRQLVRDRDRRWSAAEVLSLAAAKEPDFAPGTDFSYSNTNYVLLGEVIGSVTGSTWAEQVRARILDPLRMADTYVAGVEPLPVGVIPAYFDLDEDGNQENVENGRPWTSLETSEGAAGAIVSTASDLITFGDALFHARLLRPDMMRAMVAEGDHHPRNRGYGLGLEIERPDYRTTIWGHGGHLPGFRSTLWYVPSNDLLITVRGSVPSGRAEAVAGEPRGHRRLVVGQHHGVRGSGR